MIVGYSPRKSELIQYPKTALMFSIRLLRDACVGVKLNSLTD